MNDGTGQRETLLPPAGECAGELRQPITQPAEFEYGIAALVEPIAFQSVDSSGEIKVFAHGQVAVQTELLTHVLVILWLFVIGFWSLVEHHVGGHSRVQQLPGVVQCHFDTEHLFAAVLWCLDISGCELGLTRDECDRSGEGLLGKLST